MKALGGPVTPTYLSEGKHLYELREKVVFEYVWRVRADSPEEAQTKCENVGDGDAIEHNEVDRYFTRTRVLRRRR